MFRRILLIAALVLAAGGVATIAPAGAQSYGGCSATVSDTTPSAGDTVTVSGTGATPDGTVTALLDSVAIGSGTASGAGVFSFPATIPATASGTEELSVDCGTSIEALTLTVTPAAVATTTTTAAATTTTVAATELPRTGANSALPMAQLALASLAIGGLVLGAARMRQRAAQRPSL